METLTHIIKLLQKIRFDLRDLIRNPHSQQEIEETIASCYKQLDEITLKLTDIVAEIGMRLDEINKQTNNINSIT